jgi:hypothetical protein
MCFTASSVLIPASAQTAISPFRLVQFRTGSAIAVDGPDFAGLAGTAFGRKAQISRICVSFHNTDPRAVKFARFQFRYYDAQGDHVGGDTLGWNGTAATAERMAAVNQQTGRPNDKNCATIHFPKEGIENAVYFVEHVDFADQTTWDAQNVVFPEHLSAKLPQADTVASAPSRDGSITTPVDPTAVEHDHAASLVGAWTCVTDHGSATTKQYTREVDGTIVLDNTISLANGMTAKVHETYRYDPASSRWSVMSTPALFFGAYTGTAKPWTDNQWVFEGEEPITHNDGTRVVTTVRLVYTQLAPAGFRREFQYQINGEWRDLSEELCTAASSHA